MPTESTIHEGDQVREATHRVPPHCLPFYGEVQRVSEDGWIAVRFPGGAVRSFPASDWIREAPANPQRLTRFDADGAVAR